MKFFLTFVVLFFSISSFASNVICTTDFEPHFSGAYPSSSIREVSSYFRLRMPVDNILEAQVSPVAGNSYDVHVLIRSAYNQQEILAEASGLVTNTPEPTGVWVEWRHQSGYNPYSVYIGCHLEK